jgi:hypothetical protein
VVVSLTDNFNRTGVLDASSTTTGSFTWTGLSTYSTDGAALNGSGGQYARIAFSQSNAIYDLSVTLNWTPGSAWSHAGIFLKTASDNIGGIGVRQNGYSFGLTTSNAGTTTFSDTSTVLSGPVTLQLIYDNHNNSSAPTLIQKINGTTVGTHTFSSDLGAITGLEIYGDHAHSFDDLSFTAAIPEPSTYLAVFSLGFILIYFKSKKIRNHKLESIK